jgi:hypothetical protein
MKKSICIAAAAIMMISSSAQAADISIILNGEKFTPTNAVGQEVEPFIEGGTTYLPVRAISEAVGKEVSYDGEQNSVYIGVNPTAENAKEYPYLKVGDKIIFESGVHRTSGFSDDDYVLADRIIKLAESLFDEASIAEAAEAAKENYEDWMKYGVTEYQIVSQYPVGTLEEAYYLEGCMSLINSYDVGEPEEEYYNDYVTVKHILVSDKETSDAVLERLSNGESFDDLIEEYNTDPGQTRDSSYTFTYGDMVKEFEEASFALEEGEYTKEAVASAYGYHIIERLPLDKNSVSKDSYVSKKLNEMLPEAGNTVKVVYDELYCGEVDGLKIPTIFVESVSTDSYDDAFKLAAWITAFDNYVTEKGYVSEYALAAEMGNISENEAFLTLASQIDNESFQAIVRENAISSVLTEKVDAGEIDEEALSTEFGEYYQNLTPKRYFDTRIFVDGNMIVPSDANGEYVKAKNVDGTIYLPVRAVVEALGMNAEWDNDTRSVVITN